MNAWMRRRAIETEDWLRHHPLVRAGFCRYHLWRGRRYDPNEPQTIARSIFRACAAARMATTIETETIIQQTIVRLVAQLDRRPLDWTEFVPEYTLKNIPKATILKPYLGPNEKGVVFISFENQWVKLLDLSELAEFERRYTLIISPSNSPHNLMNYVFPAYYPGPIFTLISNPRDAEVLPGIAPNLIVVSLYASCWVNPERFVPVPRNERGYDLLMVANFGKVKRHQVLFDALRSMPRDLKILLIGQDQDGRTVETIRELASWYGVENRFELRGHQSYAEVTRAFCQARSSIVLSRKEGSCVAVTESLFADAPAALLQHAEIGSRVFLNDQTGRFLRENSLAQDLTAFVAESSRYQPRVWAEAYISCHQSSRVLNGILREHSLKQGQEWTQDIAPLQWCPDPRPVRLEDQARLALERTAILDRFGVDIGPKTIA